MEHILFNGWNSVFRILIVGILAYAGMILLLRISGKRTLSKMNAFDFIITIALGSTLATVMLNENVPLVNGVLGFGLLIFLQYIISWLSVRFETVQKLVKSKPSLLYYRGEFFEEALLNERITREEILASIREHEVETISNVDAVVLETDGTLTVIKKLLDNRIIANVRRRGTWPRNSAGDLLP